jgi:hypothetical protein
MEITEVVEMADEASHSLSLNRRVAVTVALLATFMGVCKIKDDNIVQAMQQAQADKIDHWSYYQARNVREEIAGSMATQLKLARWGGRRENEEGPGQGAGRAGPEDLRRVELPRRPVRLVGRAASDRDFAAGDHHADRAALAVLGVDGADHDRRVLRRGRAGGLAVPSGVDHGLAVVMV